MSLNVLLCVWMFLARCANCLIMYRRAVSRVVTVLAGTLRRGGVASDSVDAAVKHMTYHASLCSHLLEVTAGVSPAKVGIVLLESTQVIVVALKLTVLLYYGCIAGKQPV